MTTIYAPWIVSSPSRHSRYLDQHRVAIVCSARSGTTKALGTTNLLLRAASEALSVRKPAFTPFATSGTATPFTHVSNQRSQEWTPSSFPISRSRSISRPTSPSLAPLSQIHNGTPPDTPSSTFPFPAYFTTIDLIRTEHLKAARESVRDPELLAELEGEIERDCDGLQNFLSAAQVCDTLCKTAHLTLTNPPA